MFIKKSSIPNFEMRKMLKEAGYREKRIIENAKWIFLSKNNRYYRFVMPNEDYGKGLDTTKSVSCVYDRQRECFVN